MAASVLSASRPLRVVLDTNVVLSTLLFSGGHLNVLRHAWQDGRLIPLVSRATTHELLATLAYPKFALDHDETQTLLAAYLPYCETLALPKANAKLPVCRDPDDQAFLILAAAAQVDALISGDKDLLALHGRVTFDILKPAEIMARLSNKESSRDRA